MQKRVLAVHDISCVGKCSLTVALPIISAAGIEVAVLPTAVLSTHTGAGFTDYTFRDLTSDIIPIINHWKSLNLNIDAIYTGYLGSFEQLDLMKVVFDTFGGENKLIVVDPVMADSGKLYPAFDKDYVSGMKKLCAKADIIVPNLTEAALLLDEPYVASGYSKEHIESMLVKLTHLGSPSVVLSGVSFEKGKLGAASYDSRTGELGYYFADEVEGFYHGTGDIFASALISALMREKTLAEAIKVAVDYTVECIRLTWESGIDSRYGVKFEMAIPSLIEALK